MARQIKAGLDYFSHDCDMMQDKKIRLIFASHGATGIFIYERLLEACYSEKGYFLNIDEDFNILFCGDYNIDLNVYINALNDYIKRDLFNKKLYDKYGILTSERIQSNYFNGTERRKEVNFIKEYLLLDPTDFYGEKINVNINKINVDINNLNADNGTQSKVKKIKSNSKVYYKCHLVVVSEKEYQTCVDTYGENKTKEAFEALHNYKLSSGKKYKSDYGALNSWVWDKVKAVKLSAMSSEIMEVKF